VDDYDAHEPAARRAALGVEAAVGAVFGNVSTTEFRFAVRDPSLKRLDYVQVDHPTDGALVAQVTEVTRETSLGYEEATRKGHESPSRDHLVGRARVIGFRDGHGRLQAPRTPVPAGADVRRVDSALLAHVFGLRDTEGAYLGVVKGYDLRVILDINTLVQKHVSILAKTGAGKSYAVGVLMEELIKKGVPIVVLDPHGEHGSLAQPNNSPSDQAARRRFGVTPRNYGEHIVEYSPDTSANPSAAPFALENRNLDAREIAELLGNELTNSQMGILHAAVKSLKDRQEDYDLVTVLEAVRESASNAKWNLVSALESLTQLGVFAGKGTSVESLVQPRKVSILNLKGVSPDVQQMIVAITARRLFEARKLGKVPPFMLVTEEAHNFCPEKGMSTTASGAVMRTVASEGRKFGMGLMVVSQRPAKVDKNVLSQCSTQIILKVTNPNDLKALASSVEGLTSDSEDEIQRLPVGVAFVSHPRISIPVLVEVRPRETSHGGESVDVMASIKGARKAEPRDEGGDDEEDEGEETPAAKDAKTRGRERERDDATTPAVAAPAPSPPPRQHRLVVEPAPADVVHARAAPPAAHLPPPRPAARVPTWLQEVAEEARFVAASRLHDLTGAHLGALETELSHKAQVLARQLGDTGPEGERVLGALNAQLERIHEEMEARQRKAGVLGRLRSLLPGKERGP
jgi:DNA helicase HerA-like ATPase